MAKKSDRAIVEPVVYGEKKFKPGQEAELAEVAPQWNLAQMKSRGWISGDWSKVGLTPEEEAEAAEEAAAAAAAGKPAPKTGRGSR